MAPLYFLRIEMQISDSYLRKSEAEFAYTLS